MSKNRLLHKNNTTKNQESNLLMEFNKERIAQYTQALKEKIFILGKETHRNGMKADYSHLDYLFSIVKFRQEGTRLEDMTMLWATLWEYLGPVLGNYEKLSNAFFMLEQDQGEVLREYGENALELKIYQEFMATQNGLVCAQYENFKQIKIKEHAETLAKIKEEEDDRVRRKSNTKSKK